MYPIKRIYKLRKTSLKRGVFSFLKYDIIILLEQVQINADVQKKALIMTIQGLFYMLFYMKKVKKKKKFQWGLNFLLYNSQKFYYNKLTQKTTK